MGSFGVQDGYISSKCSLNELDLLVKELRQKILATNIPGSIVPRTDYAFLSRFIRVKDYQLEKAYATVVKYYECVHKHRDYHQGIRPTQFAHAYESKAYNCLKYRLNDTIVGVARIRLWDPKKLPLIDCQKAAIFAAEEYLNQVEVQEKGITFIFDFEGLRFEHLWLASIKEIRRCAEVALKGLPMRIASIHVLNPPKIFWPVYHIGKRFVTKKILSRVHFHSDLGSLHKFLDKERLPDFLGGPLSVEEGTETHVIEQILKKDIPFEEYWNGSIQREKNTHEDQDQWTKDSSSHGLSSISIPSTLHQG